MIKILERLDNIGDYLYDKDKENNSEENKGFTESQLRWLKENGFDEEGNTWLILGNTFEIKDELKRLGAKYNRLLGWHIGKDVSDKYEVMKVNVDYVTEPDGDEFEFSKDMKGERDKVYNSRKGLDVAEFVGEVGEKISVEVTLTDIKSKWYAPARGLKPSETFIYSFKDDKGNIYKWSTQKNFEDDGIELGNKLLLSGTVKERIEWKGVKENRLTRCTYKKL